MANRVDFRGQSDITDLPLDVQEIILKKLTSKELTDFIAADTFLSKYYNDVFPRNMYKKAKMYEFPKKLILALKVKDSLTRLLHESSAGTGYASFMTKKSRTFVVLDFPFTVINIIDVEDNNFAAIFKDLANGLLITVTEYINDTTYYYQLYRRHAPEFQGFVSFSLKLSELIKYMEYILSEDDINWEQ